MADVRFRKSEVVMRKPWTELLSKVGVEIYMNIALTKTKKGWFSKSMAAIFFLILEINMTL